MCGYKEGSECLSMQRGRHLWKWCIQSSQGVLSFITLTHDTGMTIVNPIIINFIVCIQRPYTGHVIIIVNRKKLHIIKGLVDEIIMYTLY